MHWAVVSNCKFVSGCVQTYRIYYYFNGKNNISGVGRRETEAGQLCAAWAVL